MREIPLTQGKVALVDDEDYERVAALKWFAHWKDGWYAENALAGRMQGFIMGGRDGHTVDHRDGNGLDNTRLNLRFATSQEQMQNRGRRCDARSRFKGVHWRDERQRWIARIMAQGRRRRIGSFHTEIEAAHAYDRAARLYFGEFACLNFPESV